MDTLKKKLLDLAFNQNREDLIPLYEEMERNLKRFSNALLFETAKVVSLEEKLLNAEQELESSRKDLNDRIKKKVDKSQWLYTQDQVDNLIEDLNIEWSKET